MNKPASDSKAHHWWPIAVSNYWKNAEGKTHQVNLKHPISPSPPKNFGVLTYGHSIKLSRTPGETTPWDCNFEKEFDEADSGLKYAIDWLDGLDYAGPDSGPRDQRFVPQTSDEEMLRSIVAGVVSLAIRSPRTREKAVAWALEVRSEITAREQAAITASSLRYRQAEACRTYGTRGKFVAIRSTDKEFIFGDGFYHNLAAQGGDPPNPVILVPLTPNLTILYAQPLSCIAEPKLFTLNIRPDETKILNDTIQIHSKDSLFYRQEPPDLLDRFKVGKHLTYSEEEDPIPSLVAAIPGVHPSTGIQYL